jgi:hypothetical protein
MNLSMSSQRRKIVILTSCTGNKQYTPENRLVKDDFHSVNTPAFQVRESELATYVTRAEEMYTGQQHVRLMRGITLLRDSEYYDVDLHIVSAGYGLISADKEIAPYECTFQTMKSNEIIEWSNQLGIPTDSRELLRQPADLILIALGKQYLRALQLDRQVEFGSPTLFFASGESINKIPAQSGVRILALTNLEAKRFRCGLVGLKGELVGRILRHLATDGESFWAALMDEQADLLTLLDEPAPPKTNTPKVTPRLERVGFVIHVPNSWRKRSAQKPLRFFIPDWDDMVDPDYEFLTDTHAGGRGAWSNQVYAHQMFPNGAGYIPNYDGLLVSRAVAESSRNKIERIETLGIHSYLRIPPDFPVMGDCGAFSYLLQAEPPYATDEILDYYTRLNFDFGVSIDHLLFGASDDAGKRYRYDLTIHNAETFLEEHHRQGLKWEPIGALQGLNPQQYAAAARQYVAMGYEYLAIGGQVRSKTPDILAIARAIREVIPQKVKLHLLGVARLDALNDFIQVGINSVDSASYLRQAWVRMGQNYIGHDGLYAAIRIPEAERRIKKGVSPDEADHLRRLEAEALGTLRALARGDCPVDVCLNAILAYKEALGTKFPTRVVAEYRATLTHRPWEQCDCAICKAVNVEVIMFRGNNRNRRRGFHNNYAFYRLMQKTIEEGQSTYNWKGVQITEQRELPLTFL